MAHIEIEALEKTFSLGKIEVPALRKIDLQVAEGEMICLIGPSGCGKSTLLHLIGGLDRPTAGKIRVDQADLAGLTENQLCLYRQKNLGFVFQSFNLLPSLTALENVELPLIFAGLERRQRLSMAGEMLEQVGLGDRTAHRPTELSGGQQQRVAIARALVNQPDILLADEPTGNLDTASSLEIMHLLQTMNQKGIICIIATHDRDMVSFAHRIVSMRDGLIEKVETAGTAGRVKAES